MTSDAIAAIATPLGEGAVSLLRVSGPDAVAVGARVVRLRGGRTLAELAPRTQHLGTAHDPGRGDEALDEVLVTVFRAPASYTGEDVVEISGHGGPLVTRRLLGALLTAGARSAEAGEFTQRAFLNGKLDLTQAEAVMDLIRAQSDLALAAAREQLAGSLGRRIEALREALLDLTAHLEAYIDFPDEDISPDTGRAMLARIDEARAQVAALLDTARPGRILREGARTVLFGAPNAGKSSLLNALAGRDRAIVSPTPGTTRDTIEEFIAVRGLALRLIDTAGLRDSVDPIEREGVERARRALAEADLALEIADATLPPAEARGPAPDTGGAPRLLVLNKADLPPHPAWTAPEFAAAHRVSSLTGDGVDALADAIYAAVTGGEARWSANAAAAINARHRACLARAADALDRARSSFVAGEGVEFTALELRIALNAVGDVVGGTDTESILGRIFATFCIGK